jgi:hypothetical protein
VLNKYTFLRSQVSHTGLIGPDEKLTRRMTLETDTIEDTTPKSIFSKLYAAK